MKTAIVTAGDEKYFGYLSELLASIERCRSNGEGAGIDVCVLDVGMSPDQRAQLQGRVTRVVEPGWDYNIKSRTAIPRFFQAQLSRPHLPKHFPEYERFVWLDADVWLQDWRGVELLLQASEKPVMAIVPEMHQGYRHVYRLRPDLERELQMYHGMMFGQETGNWLATLPVFNSGVFAMRADTVFWRNWGDVLGRAAPKYMGFLTEQCSLNMAIYTGLVTAYAMPAWCNWICSEATPMYDPAGRCLVSPLLPHEKISMVHLVDAKKNPPPVMGLDGISRQMALTFAGVSSQAAV
jgi:hypothetical protein